jgi:kynurenine formamidase
MIDLTAPMEAFGATPDITHMDLYYRGVVAPTDSLVTDCVVIDLTASAESVDLDCLPTLDLVRPGNSVILRTGWEQYRGTPTYADSPSVDQALIRTLVERGVVLVLIDAPGVYGGARGPAHNRMDQYLADHEAYAVENLVNVDQITSATCRLYCFPIFMTARNNAPCRVVADATTPVM